MSAGWFVVGWLVTVVSVGQLLIGVVTLAWPQGAPPWRRHYTTSRLWGWTRIVAGVAGVLVVGDLWVDRDGLGLALMSAGFALLIASNFMQMHANLSRVPEPEPEPEPEPIDPPAGAEQHGVLY